MRLLLGLVLLGVSVFSYSYDCDYGVFVDEGLRGSYHDANLDGSSYADPNLASVDVEKASWGYVPGAGYERGYTCLASSCPGNGVPDSVTGVCGQSESCGAGQVSYPDPNFGESCGDIVPDPNDCQDAAAGGGVADAYLTESGWVCTAGEGGNPCPDGWTPGAAQYVNTCSAPGTEPTPTPTPSPTPTPMPSPTPTPTPSSTPTSEPDPSPGPGDGGAGPGTGEGAGDGSDCPEGESCSGTGNASQLCEYEPVCTGNDVECAQLIQEWYHMCHVEEYEGSEPGEIYESESGDPDGDRVGEVFSGFSDRVRASGVGAAITGFFDVSFAGSCPVYGVSVGPFDIQLDQWCSSQIPWSLIAGIIVGTSLFIAARICFG